MDHDIMEVTGIPNSKLFVTRPNMFYNTSCLLFEYYDLLKAPWFGLLNFIVHSDSMSKLVDLSILSKMTMDELFSWYVFRSDRNFMMCLNYDETILKNSGIDDYIKLSEWTGKFIDNQMASHELYFDDRYNLNFYEILKNIISRKVQINKFICFSEVYSKFVENDLKSINPMIEYTYGDFSSLLDDVPTDTTYVLSDVNKMNIIADKGKLELASIILTDYYKYNFDSDTNALKLDKEKINNHTYKLDLFDNLTV